MYRHVDDACADNIEVGGVGESNVDMLRMIGERFFRSTRSKNIFLSECIWPLWLSEDTVSAKFNTLLCFCVHNMFTYLNVCPEVYAIVKCFWRSFIFV